MDGEFSYRDAWADHIDDKSVWVRFWALWELRRKWKWADWFYRQVDRIPEPHGGEIVEPQAWGTTSGIDYMKLCMWISLLRSVHEGLTTGLDANDTLKQHRIPITEVFSDLPNGIETLPKFPYRGFRNKVFHCQWHTGSPELRLDSDATNQLEAFHNELGDWLKQAHLAVYPDFKAKYNAPDYYAFAPDHL